MKKVVNFYMLRHGEYELKDHKDYLTKKGSQQITLAVKEHLSNILINFAYCGLRQRTVNSIAHALKELNNMIVYKKLSEFSYDWIPDAEKDNYRQVMGNLLEEKRHVLTPQDLLEQWNFAKEVRLKVQQKILNLAGSYSLPSGKDINVLVASQSPIIELSAAHPGKIPFLKSADIIRHRVEIGTHNETVLVSSIYLPCPRLNNENHVKPKTGE